MGPEDTPYHGGTYEVVSTGVRCVLSISTGGIQSHNLDHPVLECVRLVSTLQPRARHPPKESMSPTLR